MYFLIENIKKNCKNIIKYDNKLIIDNIELKLYQCTNK